MPLAASSWSGSRRAEALGARCALSGEQEGLMALIKKILVATDFSDTAQLAVDYAAALASEVGASVVVAHVAAIPVVAIPDHLFVTAAETVQLMRELEIALGDVKRRVEERGAVPVETELAEGNAWSELIRIAKHRGCDLIVMGTHGRTGLTHLLLGSVAEKVVRHAPISVLTVRGNAPLAAAEPVEPSSRALDEAC
jgi:nucleotide-binding universal stress UspA family protein